MVSSFLASRDCHSTVRKLILAESSCSRWPYSFIVRDSSHCNISRSWDRSSIFALRRSCSFDISASKFTHHDSISSSFVCCSLSIRSISSSSIFHSVLWNWIRSFSDVIFLSCSSLSTRFSLRRYSYSTCVDCLDCSSSL